MRRCESHELDGLLKDAMKEALDEVDAGTVLFSRKCSLEEKEDRAKRERSEEVASDLNELRIRCEILDEKLHLKKESLNSMLQYVSELQDSSLLAADNMQSQNAVRKMIDRTTARVNELRREIEDQEREKQRLNNSYFKNVFDKMLQKEENVHEKENEGVVSPIRLHRGRQRPALQAIRAIPENLPVQYQSKQEISNIKKGGGPFFSNIEQFGESTLTDENELQALEKELLFDIQSLPTFSVDVVEENWDESFSSSVVESIPPREGKDSASIGTRSTSSAVSTKIDSKILENAEVGEMQESARCVCKRTKCLKLYCQCFQQNVYCCESCTCINCKNTESFKSERETSFRGILARNTTSWSKTLFSVYGSRLSGNEKDKGDESPVGRMALARKAAKMLAEFPNSRDETSKLKVTNVPLEPKAKVSCKCTRTNCLKQYCTCFNQGRRCDGCNCIDCMNKSGEEKYDLRLSEDKEN